MVAAAHGVARSSRIIGELLRNNEAYLHWLWIDNIEKNPQEVIYVPTEANLHTLEAGWRLWVKDTAGWYISNGYTEKYYYKQAEKRKWLHP